MPFGMRECPHDSTHKLFACPGCTETFKTKKELMAHVRNVH